MVDVDVPVARHVATPIDRGPSLLERRRWSYGAIATVIVWNAWNLRATLLPVAYLNDSVMHQAMVRFAAQTPSVFAAPQLRWFAPVNLGSPHFLHYQSFGAQVVGMIGRVIGANTAFRWSLFLGIVCWPVAIYAAGRVVALSRSAATIAALVAPFVVSSLLVGYEQQAYIWVGFGLWAQLLASWALPFAWAFSWRALREPRFVGAAVIAIVATIALHFETGYLAIVAPAIFALLDRSWRARLRRAAAVVALSLAGSTWVWVPVLAQSSWAATNSALANTGLMRGYGARQDLWWLLSGQTFDAHRLPAMTALVAVGLGYSLVNWHSSITGRPFVAMFAFSLMLSFGPTTWGPLARIIPGDGDIYFRRFLVGVHLSGIFLAGIGAVVIYGALLRIFHHVERRAHLSFGTIGPFEVRSVLAGVIIAVLVAAPLVSQLALIDESNAHAIGDQRAASVPQRQVDLLIDYVHDHPGGRVYAGSISNWGRWFTVGQVPVVSYLADHDVDVVGLNLRTASLMSQPEVHFDDHYSGDYALFAVGYVIEPHGRTPSVPATLVEQRGPYVLWRVSGGSYFTTITTVGVRAANRSNVGSLDRDVRREGLFARHESYLVAWDGASVASRTVGSTTTTPGVVRSSSVNWPRSSATTTVTMTRRGFLVLSSSFDPGWSVSVDGRTASTVMVAPAVVGVELGVGTHVVVFRYHGFAHYWWLVALSGVTLAGRVVAFVRGRRESSPAGSERT